MEVALYYHLVVDIPDDTPDEFWGRLNHEENLVM